MQDHHGVQGRSSNVPELSVSDLSFALKRTVEQAFDRVRVRGEISGFKRAASGHIYMSLKDPDANIDAIIWRGKANALSFKPEDGLEVIATGKLTTYPGRSKYQIVIDQMEPAGAGALMALLEQRKKALAAEGLFAPERKQPLPFLPKTIGVVTSPTGAVIRDILHRLADRCPTHVLIWPVIVQGDGAAEQIASAIDGFNALTGEGNSPTPPDVIIVARGGGSLEDLWAFNEDVVVRAAARSRIPLVSAVGHETDTTLIDYASDRRAPTPTAAAEFCVPVLGDLRYTIEDYHRRMIGASNRMIAERRTHLTGLSRGLRGPADILAMKTQRLDDVAERLSRAPKTLVEQKQNRLSQAAFALRPKMLERDLTARTERLLSLQQRLSRNATTAGQRDAEHLTRLSRHLHQTMTDTLRNTQHALSLQSRVLASVGYTSVLKRGFAVIRSEDGQPVSHIDAIDPNQIYAVELSDGTSHMTPVADAPPKTTMGNRASQKAKPKTKPTTTPKGPTPSTTQGSLFE